MSFDASSVIPVYTDIPTCICMYVRTSVYNVVNNLPSVSLQQPFSAAKLFFHFARHN